MVSNAAHVVSDAVRVVSDAAFNVSGTARIVSDAAALSPTPPMLSKLMSEGRRSLECVKKMHESFFRSSKS